MENMMKDSVTVNEAKQRVTVLARVNAKKATTFNGLFRLVMKELANGSKFDKGLYSAVKEAGSTKKIKLWIDEAIQNINIKF